MIFGTFVEASTSSQSETGEINCPGAEAPMQPLSPSATSKQIRQWKIENRLWQQREQDRKICEEHKKNQETGGPATLAPFVPSSEKHDSSLTGASS